MSSNAYVFEYAYIIDVMIVCNQLCSKNHGLPSWPASHQKRDARPKIFFWNSSRKKPWNNTRCDRELWEAAIFFSSNSHWSGWWWSYKKCCFETDIQQQDTGQSTLACTAVWPNAHSIAENEHQKCLQQLTAASLSLSSYAWANLAGMEFGRGPSTEFIASGPHTLPYLLHSSQSSSFWLCEFLLAGRTFEPQTLGDTSLSHVCKRRPSSLSWPRKRPARQPTKLQEQVEGQCEVYTRSSDCGQFWHSFQDHVCMNLWPFFPPSPCIAALSTQNRWDHLKACTCH